MFLGKGVLKIWSKFTGEQPCRSAISIKLLCIYFTPCSSVSIVNFEHAIAAWVVKHFVKDFLRVFDYFLDDRDHRVNVNT